MLREQLCLFADCAHCSGCASPGRSDYEHFGRMQTTLAMGGCRHREVRRDIYARKLRLQSFRDNEAVYERNCRLQLFREGRGRLREKAMFATMTRIAPGQRRLREKTSPAI